ncbi:dTDP-glucose 4,6-dehydratase [Kallotenue papyrolyticum]|uniref:dTDP-glucose 4,6-dehydratase n=1 Tax=Kallotenue papyrolyticum TaxID=1325125 RepID=UPI0004924C81|nr:dTDP-glucose 4,6-dehydratase [Kallotenue papyrolyticum]
MRNLLVTGGAGFIGANFVQHMLQTYPDYRIVVFDKLTYAGNLNNLKPVADHPRYAFVQGDICDAAAVRSAIKQYDIDTIVNFAAETHVDRSILDPDAFVRTNVYGPYVLCEAAKDLRLERLHHISTDEVYGPIPSGRFREEDRFNPTSPYAAAKAGGELLVLSYFRTYNLPVTVTRGVNTYGPYQYPEKAIPLFVTNAIDDQPLPLYGDGSQVRDRLHALDHARAVDVVLHRGTLGEAYNVAADMEHTNIDVARRILRLLGKPETLIQPVADRPAHDVRYALDAGKLRALGWQPQIDFEQGLADTVRWYVENEWWWRPLKSGEYLEYYRRQYLERERTLAAEVLKS